MTSLFSGVKITRENGGFTEIECYQDGKSAVITDAGSFIFDIKEGTITETNNRERVYYKAKIDNYKTELKSFIENIRNKRINEIVSETGLTDDIVEELLYGDKDGEAIIYKVSEGSKKKTLGYECKVYRIRQGDTTVEELCVSDSIGALISEEIDFVKLGKLRNELNKEFGSLIKKENSNYDELIEKIGTHGYIISRKKGDEIYGNMEYPDNGAGAFFFGTKKSFVVETDMDLSEYFEIPNDYIEVPIINLLEMRVTE